MAVINSFKAIAHIFGPQVYWAFMSSFIENLSCRFMAEKNCIFIVTSRIAHSRAKTLLTKEPETIRWIDELPADSILLDIGANVGTYTIYAARVRGMKVIAVEPSPENYATLIKNIAANGLDKLVIPICAAAASKTHFGPLYKHYGGIVAGGSGIVFNSSRISDNEEMPSQAQHAFGIAIDDLLDLPGTPYPTHMKLDIIGTQDRALGGAKKTLARLSGAMIETPGMRESNYQICMDLISAGGLVLDRGFQSRDPTEQFFKRS